MIGQAIDIGYAAPLIVGTIVLSLAVLIAVAIYHDRRR